MGEAIFVNAFALFVNAAILAFCLGSGGYMLTKRKRVRLPQFYILLLCVTLWSAVSVIRYTSDSEALVYFMTFLPMILSLLSLIALFNFTMIFYNLKAYAKRRVIAASCLFPLTGFLAIIISYFGLREGSDWANLIIYRPVIITEPLNGVTGAFGRWMEVYIALSMFYAAGLFALTLLKHLSLPKIYRSGSESLLIGMVLLFIGYTISVFNSSFENPMFDIFSLGLFAVALHPIFRSTLKSQGLIFLAEARDEILGHLDDCIFVLDDDYNIVYVNEKAETELNQRVGDFFPDFLATVEEKATKCVKLTNIERGRDYYTESEGKKAVFCLREKPILDKKEKQIGTYIIYSDVTQNREFIRRLEEGAGRDALTGLHSRAMMEKLKAELDKPEALPISIVMCDLNNLKVANDLHGHQAGDTMLRVCGEAIAASIPPTVQAGRIGGDEFMLILPQTAKLETLEIMSDINKFLENAKEDYPFEIVLSMGCAIKEKEDQDLTEIMAEADKIMYENKRELKGIKDLRSSKTKLF